MPDIRPAYPVVVLCLLAVLIVIVVDAPASGAPTGIGGHDVRSQSTARGDVVAAAGVEHDGHCRKAHDATQSSHCSSCSCALPPTILVHPAPVTTNRAVSLVLLYDDVVPLGIRRPPRPS